MKRSNKMTNDCARFVALRILEQAIEDATCKKTFIRAYNQNLKNVHKNDALHFFRGAWFPIVAELAGFDSDAIDQHVKKANHKKVRKTL